MNEKLKTRYADGKLMEQARNDLEWAWTIIANAGGGNWEKETKDWQDAAAQWRDNWHATYVKPLHKENEMPTEEECNTPAAPETAAEKASSDRIRANLSDGLKELQRNGYPNRVNPAQLDTWFTFHSPDPEQIVRYGLIRTAARAFAQVLLDNTPGGADQTAMFRELRNVVMSANQSIACAPKEK